RRGNEAFFRPPVAERHALANDALIADARAAVNHDSTLMLNHDATAQLDRVWKLNSVVIANIAKEHPVEHTEGSANGFRSNSHSPLAEPANGDGAKAGQRPIATVCDPIFLHERPQRHLCWRRIRHLIVAPKSLCHDRYQTRYTSLRNRIQRLLFII